MKKILTIILFFILIFYSLFSMNTKDAIKNANELIKLKKYESAMKLLDKFDPDNNNPDAVILKTNIFMKYFVWSIMHQMFSLKDIPADKSIEDYRGKVKQTTSYSFQADKILNRLIKKFPNNIKLYDTLAKYYYESYLRYGRKWIIEEKKLFDLMENNLKIVMDKNMGDYLSNYIYAFVLESKGKIKECVKYFEKSIKLNNEYPSSHYNLAYAYYNLKDYNKAIPEALISLKQYNDKVYKGDAARLVGVCYIGLNDFKNAIKYYLLSDKIDKDNYYTLRSLLSLYLETKNVNRKNILNRFFNLAPDNPTIYNDINYIYRTYNMDKELIDFYKQKLSFFENNDKVLGTLYFYLGNLNLTSNKNKSKEYFLKAKKHLEKVFKKNNQVFDIINQALNELENKK